MGLLSQDLPLGWADRRKNEARSIAERASFSGSPAVAGERQDYIAFGLALAIGFLAALAIGFLAVLAIGFFIAIAVDLAIGAGDCAIAGAAEMMNALAQSAMRIRFI